MRPLANLASLTPRWRLGERLRGASHPLSRRSRAVPAQDDSPALLMVGIFLVALGGSYLVLTVLTWL